MTVIIIPIYPYQVSHVINFDCPSFMSDYIHRVGRVGRIGQKAFAKVTTLVSQKYEVDLIWRIEVGGGSGTKRRY